MTSSSDAATWTPLDLASAGSGPPPPAGFAPAFRGLAAADEAQGWLPPLRTSVQDQEASQLAVREQEGYRQGYEEARREESARAEERVRTALQAVAKAAAQLDGIAAEFARDRERDVHGLAITVARHIVQHELALDPGRLGELVGRALDLLPLDNALELRLHPDDLRVLGASVEQMQPPGRHVKLTWIADASVERGGFVIESPQRIVDGRADVALRTLYERLEHD